ncbi:Leucyl/phenylalanyl-tRNA--protein transferase [Posidoniimonas polymericola]|uniref:Leucyl/phenylalanyl-tRNA--protein transferase n=1 Tax=Posidoniimonas polymericola TaxID=2528002 RepID=A0A5C5XXP5_9BACT|nr:leucyl/phenylalanyl-tRNA--protein transferase [Posidoniimonas polymericola]TWT67644.1 Leucyl/phenylalanyl-tRNA--protein transferase [Posidoniimonas polymericola]
MNPARSSIFPPPSEASPEGLVAIGGRLDPEWLLDAYRHGIFPWPDDDHSPLLWWSPDPRAVIELDGLHVSRRLRRRLRSGRFRVTLNQAFDRVMQGCASAPDRRGGTWITTHMKVAYGRMHELGHAHSVEVWRDNQLVGGVYGVSIGGAFAAESMFHLETDASKVALASLVAHLAARGHGLLDIQQWTEHTGSMGAVEISRGEFVDRLAAAIARPVTMGSQLDGDPAALASPS